MKLVYSVGVPFNASGLGFIGATAAQAFEQENELLKVLCPFYYKGAVNSRLIKSFPAPWLLGKIHSRLQNYTLKDSLFDKWAAFHLPRADVFYGWAHQSLSCLHKAQKNEMLSFIDRGSVEPQLQKKLIQQAFEKQGLKAEPMPKEHVLRMQEEEKVLDYLVVPSDFARNSYLQAGWEESRVLKNPLGVDSNRFCPSEDKKEVDVLFLGQLSFQKGVDLLLEAWKVLQTRAFFQKEKPKLRLLGWPEKASWPTLKNQLHNLSNVEFLGPTANPEKELIKTKILVLPSVQDGFASVVLEAMASGIPVLVSEHVGASECVRHGKDGYVIAPANKEALIEALYSILSSPESLRQMGLHAREQALNYSWQAYQQRLLKLVHERVS